MNLFIKYPVILFIAQSFISFSPIAQTSNPTSASAAAFYLEGNMMEANMQYGALLSVEPENIDYQYYYAVTCTADSALRMEGINRLKALEGLGSYGGERLFFLALAYHHLSDYTRAIKVFKRAEQSAVRKSVWLSEVKLRLAQCEAALANQTSLTSFTRHSSVTVSLEDFFRSIPTNDSPYRMILLPTELRTKYDKKRGWVSPVAFDAEADLMYFSSYGKKGETGLDIYSAKILKDGSLALPERLPESVNSLSDEINPFFHAGSSTLIFASNRQSSLGGYDIFSSGLNSSSGSYLDCTAFQSGINSPLNEFAYYPLDYLGKGWLVSDKAGYFSEPILSEIEFDIDVQIEPKVEAEVEIESEAEVESVAEAEVESVAEAEVESVVEAEVESVAEVEKVAEVVEPIEIIIPVEPDKQETQQQPNLELSSSLSIQIGVFSNEPDVNLLLFDFNLFTLILPNGLYKVFAGPYENEAERAKYKQKLIEAGFTDVFNVVAKP
ncbi:SPOR domain-containing protein [Flavobacteriales bacterium]|nr:SPOR domain-containing protein [Flavobacteriales bacterium]